MDFDPTRPHVTPREAATVILVRARADDGAAEVFLLRRHRGASFMARSFVFPGGGREGDEDPRRTAARELFEEAGVLLADRPLSAEQLAEWRARQAAGEDLGELLASAGAALDLDSLEPYAHWITPSAEKRRFSARFFVAELPSGQTPSFDNVETVDERWVTPSEGLARAGELRLPPPQLRVLHELAAVEAQGPSGALALARQRGSRLLPIVPRYLPLPERAEGFALVLPWDADYAAALGASEPWPPEHADGEGPARFYVSEGLWRME